MHVHVRVHPAHVCVCAPAHSNSARLVEYRDKKTRVKSDKPAFVVEYMADDGEQIESMTYYVEKHPRAFRAARAARFLTNPAVLVMRTSIPVF